eukprot:5096682-Pyramimonas_sp.AAC.1
MASHTTASTSTFTKCSASGAIISARMPAGAGGIVAATDARLMAARAAGYPTRPNVETSSSKEASWITN